jgi:MSHA biogenesis protein MshJ
MSALGQRILDAIDARTLRERLLLLAAAVAVIVLLTDVLFVSPAQKRLRSDNTQLAAVRAELATLDASIAPLQRQLEQDPDEDTRRRIETLDAEIVTERNRLASAVARFIDPVQMNRVLQTLVSGHQGLELVAVRSVPASPLLSGDGDDAASPSGGAAQVWRRPVEVELSGGYSAMLAYLRALETLPWELRWDVLTVSVENDEAPRFTLRLHTLSLTSEWIGG